MSDPATGVWNSAVLDSIYALPPTERVPRYRALALLAVKYAAILDANDGDPAVLLDFGPKLQSALIALGCAPIALKGTKTNAEPGPPNKLDELHARRVRKSRAEAVDSSAS